MPMPTKRNDNVVEEILKRLSEGEPLAAICRSDRERYPHPVTWGEWCSSDEALAIAYARAREVGFDAIAADCLSIADETAFDTKLVGDDKREVADTEWISRSKLRVETRLKLLAKWDPKRYGDAMLHKHGDADGGKIPIGDVDALTRLSSLSTKLRERLGVTDDSE